MTPRVSCKVNMVRTHSSHTASPTRFQSPQRSPARRPSQDGSQYEMDLDALGLNSTFESTELDNSHRPPVDHLETSEIEGPEDFTMNMTYWMTADLPLAQVKSRKEANTRRPVIRMDAMQEGSEGQGSADKPAQERTEQRRDDRSRTASPTRRANGNTGERTYSKPPSERSMENEEKVRSFLSNLPDTEMDGAITGTPRHVPRHSFLQVPRSSPPKARSLQPTVEDYDTPRKPTAETVIRHTSAVIDTSEQDAARNKIMELQSQLEQQESKSRSRITELETLLSYTRSDLENARTDNYRQKERVSSLEKSMAQQTADHEASRTTTESEVKARESALETKMHEFGEEMRVQNLAKLETMVEEFERQRKALEESKRQLTEEVKSKTRSLEEAQTELANARREHEQDLQQPETKDEADKERLMLAEQLSSVQARAQALQSSLESATSEARAAREDAQNQDAMRSAAEAKARGHATRITELEAHLSTARFEVQCAEADMAAKKQLFQTNIDLGTRLRVLQAELESAQRGAAGQDQDGLRTADLQARIRDLESQLELVRSELASKETEITSLRSQLESTSPHKSDQDQTHNTAHLESTIRSLQSQLQSAHDDLASKDQQLSQHLETQQHTEQRLNTSLGRTQSLEASLTSLRAQLASAHRDAAKAHADAERFKQDLDDATDLLQDARADAQRRITDLERKLSQTKVAKVDAEAKYKELRAQHDDWKEGHEAMVQDVRDKADDAVRKAATLLDQERSEKKRLQKNVKTLRQELDGLRAAAAASASDDESSTTAAAQEDAHNPTHHSSIPALRTALAARTSETSFLKKQTASLRQEIQSLHLTSSAQISSLQQQLLAQKAEHEALDAAVDEKLAGLLNGLVKEKARSVVGVRDGQWEERVKGLVGERALLGKVVMRQWGREELGEDGDGKEEGRGKQKYGYKFVKRER
ncbi:spindle pole body associated [Pyrenophora seminiperda CCB06]|uniref:Spindle pole body associated n=1 Tax=Pyrenophora seminiperda CCB06 TaxID=1302712 RepID=A0A3M7M1C3_9PLEO|nr:spindle pole body associated [Pyrenophora seminiperda CCB06]